MLTVGFYQAHLCLRGTTVALFDYAYHNQKLLGNKSIVIYDSGNQFNDISVLKKFSDIFDLVPIEGDRNVENINLALKKYNCDAVYVIKGGYKRDGLNPTFCKSLIHAVAMAPPQEKHGDVWAYASHWLKEFCAPTTDIPVVPHMVDLPQVDENLRNELGIPKTAIVFGRHGGLDTWNLPWADHVIHESLNVRKDIYYIFQNTSIKFDHPRVIHIPPVADMTYKTKFINTCNAMIHARHEGESFGLACAEFSLRNKPIITWSGSRERSHIQILGEKAHLYSTPKEMLNEILCFERKYEDYNCYKEYSPQKVMNKFYREFLS